LPDVLTSAEFERAIRSQAPEALTASAVRALEIHYRSLLRWNERTSLVGPGTIEDALDVHYGEALAALPLLGDSDGKTLVDVGSGGGFPGFVLAAARPGLRCVLVEARERKWSFLKAVALESGIGVQCLLGTVDRTLPKGFPTRVDYVTIRALKLSAPAWQAILGRLARDGRILTWAGQEEPEVPPSFRAVRTLDLPGTRAKRIIEYATD
jgi:16S rRNA (guanine527-N7)-methyltransferase